MKFVGGPMHGQEVPDDAQRVFINGREILSVLALDLAAPDESLVQTTFHYVKMPYWRFCKPMLYYFAQVSLNPDELFDRCREVLGS